MCGRNAADDGGAGGRDTADVRQVGSVQRALLHSEARARDGWTEVHCTAGRLRQQQASLSLLLVFHRCSTRTPKQSRCHAYSCVTLTFDLLTSGSVRAERLPCSTVCLPSLVLIAQAVFLSERRHTKSKTPLTLSTHRLCIAGVSNNR